jgi:hypothetical protein
MFSMLVFDPKHILILEVRYCFEKRGGKQESRDRYVKYS